MHRLRLVASLLVLLSFWPAPAQAAPRCFGRTADLVGTSDPDVIRGSRRHDVIQARGGDDVVAGRRGNDRLCGGGGRDLLRGQAGNDRMSGGARDDAHAGGAGHDRAFGGAGNDLLLDARGNDRHFGGGGNDLFDLRAGDDRMAGGPGNDYLLGGADDDVYDGGTGFDLGSWLGAPSPVTASIQAGLATGFGSDTLISIEDLEGGPAADTLTGNAGSNIVFGGDGDDCPPEVASCDGGAPGAGLRGGPGNDLVFGGAGDDAMYGEDGDDVLTGGQEGESGGGDLADGGPGADRCLESEVTADCEETAAPRIPRWGYRASLLVMAAAIRRGRH